jgi:hypothetical protein
MGLILTLFAGSNSFRPTLPANIYLLGILIFKGLTARRLYKSFGVKGLTDMVTNYAAGKFVIYARTLSKWRRPAEY